MSCGNQRESRATGPVCADAALEGVERLQFSGRCLVKGGMSGELARKASEEWLEEFSILRVVN